MDKDKDKQILDYIRLNPYISQQELADKLGLSRPAIAGYISNLTKKGVIKGRAYVLREDTVITCIGTSNFDRKAYSKQKMITGTANPVEFSESCGGVARNVAENLARLGLHATLVSCVGNDREGELLLDETRRAGVDVSQVNVLPDERTGTYTTLLDTTGEMFIAIANYNVLDRLTSSMLAERWSAVASSQAVFLDSNVSAESLSYVIERCRDENIPLYVDPVSLPDAQKLPQRLDGVHCIFPNRHEAGFLAGMVIERAEDCRIAARKIKDKGVRNVIITMGDQGLFYSSEEEERFLPTFSTEVVDVTGAGDAFTAGYLFGIVREESMHRACQLGLAASSIALQSDQSVSPKLQPNLLYSLLNEHNDEEVLTQ
ncbi:MULTISPECIES: carbohydrate kinase [unclassified Paenibacillus]|uniref:carbohydrate kinase n=1 Tax=unclassified Paenibacillus TaxID=185978 RepID=UPI001C11D2E5|nr:MULTISPECIES: carbohydrate kinase [unclassified Paenibacillus]MBU5440758.1 winged helix-turn-helix transcriptional regulator [Paenibacillus sp. MSJ-34]CAH0120386.1 Pseudouridine kinase [Paenibacillus sp. CECT 9249]